MCGRSVGSRSVPNLRVITGASRFLRAARHFASHNVCPGNNQPVLRRHRGQQDDDLKSNEDENFDDDDEEMTQADADAEEESEESAARVRSSSVHVAATAPPAMCGRSAPMSDDPLLASSSQVSAPTKTQPDDLPSASKSLEAAASPSAFEGSSSSTQKESQTQTETEQKEPVSSTSKELSDTQTTFPDVSKPSAFPTEKSSETPTSSIPEVSVAHGQTPSGDLKTLLHPMRWGIVPSYTKGDDLKGAIGRSYKMINARSEKLGGIWKRLAQHKRCVLPADGFFEWYNETKGGVKKKRPYFIRVGEGEPMFMAALWDKWRSPRRENQPDVFSYTVVTTAASQKFGWLHDRMPLILDAEGCRKWLDTENYSIEDMRDIIRPWKGKLEWYEVPPKYVGNAKDKSSRCIERMSDFEAKKRKQGIHRFFAPAPKKTKPKSDPALTKKSVAKKAKK